MKKGVFQVLLQIIPVVVGILIALFIDNWKEKNDNQRFLDSVMSSIEQEMQSNLTDLEEVLARHEVLMDTLGFYLEIDSVSITDIAIKVKGIQSPQIQNVAWRAFLNAKIELIDYSTIAILTAIDDAKENLDSKLNRLANYAYENIQSGEKSVKETFALILSDVMDSEKRLLVLHRTFFGEAELIPE